MPYTGYNIDPNDIARYARSNYGSGAKQRPSANRRAYTCEPARHPGAQSRYRQPVRKTSTQYLPQISKTEVFPAARKQARDSAQPTYARNHAESREPYPEQSPPPRKPRKRHILLKTLGVLFAVAVIVAAAIFLADALKSDADRQADYTGTWQMQAIGNAANPILSLGSSFLASSATDIDAQMKIGIIPGRAQLVTFGIAKDYTFSFERDKASMVADDSSSALELALRFGKLVVTDHAAGTAIVYEKVSGEYAWIEGEGQVDTEAILDIASDISEATGGYGADIIESIDESELQHQLENVDPAVVQQVLSSVDTAAIVSGHPEDAIDVSDPAVQELVSSVDVNAILEEFPEAAAYIPEGTDVNAWISENLDIE